jgi:thiol:disulfide interchange protein/DsbC/DsbD-like thiol-disulfide interchange protein
VIEASKLARIFGKRMCSTLMLALAAILAVWLSVSPAPLAAQDASVEVPTSQTPLAGAAGSPREVIFGSENIGAQLIAEGSPVAGEVWHLALHFTPIGPEWHGYWANPGDAGLGMVLDWQLPSGWEAGKPLYPVPNRLVISDLMNHTYKGAYTVLIPVSVPQDAVLADAAAISVFANYLACSDEICVPQDALLSLRPGAANGGPRFDAWRAAIAPMLDSEAAFAIEDKRLKLAIPLPQGLDLTDPHVFIENIDLVAYAEPQTFRRDGDILVAEIPLGLGDRGPGMAPERLSGILGFGGAEGVRFEALAGAVPAGGEPVGLSMRELPSAWAALAGALLGGLLLNIMPCVFPILSLKALSLAKAGGAESAARRDALAYTAGVVLTCVALGVIMLALRAAGEQVGWAFQLQSPGVVVALLVLASVIAANFAGVFELPNIAPSSLGKASLGKASLGKASLGKASLGKANAGTTSNGRLDAENNAGGWSSSFGTGLLAAIAATPCTGPFMAAAMGAALLLPVPIALGLFAALGLGLALPFLAIGFVPAIRARLPKPGPWMARFRRLMAVPMGLTALALIWLVSRLGGKPFALFALLLVSGIVLALVIVGRLQRGGRMAWPAFPLAAAPFAVIAAFALPASYAPPSLAEAASLHNPARFSEAVLTEKVGGQNPVFIWFTADWCLTCKVNERTSIEQQSVRDAFKAAGVVTIRADWTRRDAEITRFLTSQGAAGVPLYLYYPAGAAEPQVLPQILTPDMLAELAAPAS